MHLHVCRDRGQRFIQVPLPSATANSSTQRWTFSRAGDACSPGPDHKGSQTTCHSHRQGSSCVRVAATTQHVRRRSAPATAVPAHACLCQASAVQVGCCAATEREPAQTLSHHVSSLNAAQYVCRRGGAAVTAHISCGLRSPAAMLRRPVHCHLAGSLMTQNSGALASSHCLKVQQDAHASACLLQLPAAGVRALAGSLINQGRCRDSIPAGAAPARWLPKVASSHMRLALSLQCCSAAHVRHKVPPHQQTLLTLVNAATREALATQSWLRGHIQQKPTLYHSAFSLCCRRSYSTGSHAGLQQAAAAAAAMKVSVRRGTCVSPGRARVQRLPDPGQPPELALSARAVTSPQGQVCRPAQHGPACHMSVMFCAAC